MTRSRHARSIAIGLLAGAVTATLVATTLTTGAAGSLPGPLAEATPSMGPTASTAPTPGPTPSGGPGLCSPPADPMVAQMPLVDAADAIDAVVGTAGAGFAGITLAIEQCQVHVYWVGPLPASVAMVVDDQRHNVDVVVHTDARYPNTELAAWADQLLDDPSHGQAAGVEVTGVSVLPEGNGLAVDVWPLPAEPPTPPEAAASAALSVFGQQGFPVTAVAAVPLAEPAGRANDRSPWIAGAVHRVPGGGTCTTGWALRDGADRYLLTAAHCIGPLALGANISNGDGTRVIGTVAGYMRAIDSAIIQVNVGGGDNVWPRTWWGDIGGVETMKVVDDWDGTYKGQRICTSGAATGVHCFTRVTDSDYRYRNSLGWRVDRSARGTDVDGDVAAGLGDSGGPVLISAIDPATRLPTKVAAIGTVASVDGRVPCRGAVTTTCYKTVIFTRIKPQLDRWGTSLVTG